MNKQELILNYIPLANKLAWEKSQKTPNNVTFEDLKSAAYLGLAEAANRFNPNLGCFSNYAAITIKGRIKDHLNFCFKSDTFNKIELENSFKQDYFLDDFDFFDFLKKKLGPTNGNILFMYYIEEKTMKEIGDLLGLSESRISQVLKLCHSKIKTLLRTIR